MIDLHHHLIFGVDDGSPDLETSVAMVQMACDDGVTHIVATPHANQQFPYERSAHEQKLQQIRDALLPATAERMTLGLGCDFHLDYDNTADMQKIAPRYVINHGPYLLVELPDLTIPARIDDVLYELRVHGMIPILTHPERNSALQRSRTRLHTWMEGDLLVQVTAGSLTGTFGKTAERFAWELMEKNWVHFVSSDAHNLTRRTPRMGAAYQLVSKRMGEETARRLFIQNPKAVFDGQSLPPQPEPVGVYGEPAQSWWQQLIERFR